MRKRSDKEEYNINLAIFIGVVLFSTFILYSLNTEYKTITGNQVMECPALSCPSGYSAIDTDGNSCPDACRAPQDDTVSQQPAVCGNGVCETEESSSYDPPCAREACSGQYNPRGYTTCPQDCPGQPTQQESASLCGNDICESTETGSSCPQDCSQQATTSCYDTDGGKNLLVNGTASGNSQSISDRCYILESSQFVTSCSGGDCGVMEAFCESGATAPSSSPEYCPSSTNSCSEGACYEATCSDSDGGDNIFEKGTVTYPNVDSRYNTDRCYDYGSKQFVENCSGPNCGVWEVWCGENQDGIFTDSAFEYCPDTCGNGACTGEPAQATQCVEDWQCSDFTDCVNGEQLRSCIDNNQCGTTSDKPSLSQTCLDERNEPVTPNETTTSTVSESAETQLPAGSSQAASTTAQQPASTTSSQANNNAAAIIVLVLFAGAIGVASFFIVQALGRKKLVKQLDEIMKRASSSLQLNDLKGANSNYAVLREYFSTYQNKIPKKDLVRLKEQGLKIYNEIVARQNATNAVTAP